MEPDTGYSGGVANRLIFFTSIYLIRFTLCTNTADKLTRYSINHLGYGMGNTDFATFKNHAMHAMHYYVGICCSTLRRGESIDWVHLVPR